MSMGTIGKAMKATRTQMIEGEADSIASDFTDRFRMRDGDYLRFRKTGQLWKRARVISVEKCYWNNAGGYTAWITIAPLLAQGQLGKTRSLYMAVDADGSNLRGVHSCNDIERLPQRRPDNE